MATAIFFGGRRINIPGAYSEIDASALAQVAPGAVGIVALVGTAEGGKPLTVDSSEADATRPGTIFERYRSGDLRTAGQFAFEPSNDEAIPGGAQRVVGVKVNPATQSVATLADAAAADAVDLTSRDYGLFTAQINIEVATGTIQGKLITIVFEGTTETIDNVGGDPILNIAYDGGADGYDAVTGLFDAAGFVAAGTKDEAGLDSERTADIPAPGVLDVVSSDGGDTTQVLTVVGLDGSNNVVVDTIALNGTTNVTGTVTFTKVISAELDAATAGTVTVSDSPITSTLFTIAPATLTRGLQAVTNMPVENDLVISVDADTANDLVLEGLAASGALTRVRVDLTTAQSVPVTGITAFDGGQLQRIHLGDTPAARTVTVAADAAQTSNSVYNTIQKLVDRLNTKDGFTATGVVSNVTSFLVADMDYGAAPTALAASPGGTDFLADLNAFIRAVNLNSGLITAARATGASQVPANTVSPVFLQGGVEGTPTITEWQQAFDLLKKRRVNIIVPLTEDPAVHNLLVQHLRLRAGTLRSEANGYVGIGTADGAGETLANIKSQIQVLGTRHVSAVSQEGQRFDPDTGEATFYPPHYVAAILAGMQAGSPIGEPLTFKRPLLTDLRQDSSWNPEDDTEELIDSGLVVLENKDGVGIRVVRSITTYLADDNVVFSEMSANESANTAIFEFRTAMETRIGQRGLVGTVAAIKGLANDTLSRLLDDDIIFAYRSLTVEQVGDVFPISVEIAPILPINFIPITVHLVAARAAA